jgi:hypothetical protein
MASIGDYFEWKEAKDRRREEQWCVRLADRLERARMEDSEFGDGPEIVWQGCRIAMDYNRRRVPSLVVILDGPGGLVVLDCDTLDEAEQFIRQEARATHSS